MNNFYASVECKLDESIKNKPVVVAGEVEARRGVVIAKNYDTKPYGINVGDTVWQAKNKCKNLVIISPPHFEEYYKFSKMAKSIYERFTDYIEPFGLDECWLDVTRSTKLFGSPKEIADKIREAIKKELGVTISVGVSFNKIFAKLGSDMKKPDATTVISKENFKEKIWPLPISTLIGVGYSTKKILDKYRIKTIGDIARERKETLIYWLGKSGEMLYQYANGLDDSLVQKITYVSDIKSAGHGMTTVKDLVKNDEVWKVIFGLTKEISDKLKYNKKRAKGVAITIKNNLLMKKQYQRQFNMSKQATIEIAREAYKLFLEKYDWDYPIRSVTVTAINLINDGDMEEQNIFENSEKQNKIEVAEKYFEKLTNKYIRYK